MNQYNFDMECYLVSFYFLDTTSVSKAFIKKGKPKIKKVRLLITKKIRWFSLPKFESVLILIKKNTIPFL